MQSHYQNNAYRILGLPGNASRTTVLETANSLRLRARLAMPTPHADPLGRFFPLQLSESLLDDALRRLQNPARRIQERLFWFTSADSVDADCWKNLEQGELAFAKAGWSQSTMISRRANAARTSHLFAITAAPSEFERKHWATALDAWKRILDLEGFWKFQEKLEDDAGFLPLANAIEFAQLKAEAPRILLRVHASAAGKALGKDEFEVAAGHLAILRKSAFPPELLSTLENAAVERFGSRLEQAVQSAEKIDSRVECLRVYHETIKPGWQSVFLDNRTGTAVALHLGEALSKFLLQLAGRFLSDLKPNLSAECLEDAIAITAGTALARRQAPEFQRLRLAIQAQRQQSARSSAKSANSPSAPPASIEPVSAIQGVCGIPLQESANDEEVRLLKESRYGLLDKLMGFKMFSYEFLYWKVLVLFIVVISQMQPPTKVADFVPPHSETQAQADAGVPVPAGYVLDRDPVENLHADSPVQSDEPSSDSDAEISKEAISEEEISEDKISEDDPEIDVNSESGDENSDGEPQGENDESNL